MVTDWRWKRFTTTVCPFLTASRIVVIRYARSKRNEFQGLAVIYFENGGAKRDI